MASPKRPKAKGNKPRTIDLTQATADVLAKQPQAKCQELFHRAGNPLKFASERFRGKVLLAQKAAQKAGVDFTPFRFHDLRHLYAVEYLRAGGSIYMLQQQLGHASITTTEGYLRFLTPEQAKKAKQMGWRVAHILRIVSAMKENKTDRLHIVIEPTLKRQFQEAASTEGLRLSAWIVRVLTLASKKALSQNKAQ